MIQLNKVSIALGGTTILQEMNLQIPAGQKVALSGASGSGKTTLLKSLIGWHVPVQGKIHMDGIELTPAHIQSIRSKVFYLQQDIMPNGDETVTDYITYPFRLTINKSLKYSASRAKQLFEELRLKESLLQRPLYELSGGERKRVGLVRGLLLARPIILLDEPTSAVDASNRRTLVDCILALANTTVLAVTHDDEFMERADTHYQIVDSRLMENDTRKADS